MDGLLAKKYGLRAVIATVFTLLRRILRSLVYL